jgi:rod shape determining protein RodA
MILIPMALIARQPDLGSALSVGAAGFSMLLFAGIRWKTLVVMALVVGVAVVPAWNSLHSYQQRRVIALFDPEADPLGSGYHITQSKIAVGSGSAFGKGFLKGTQTQLEFLPEHTTDFIFSVLAEEWGFVGCVMILLLYFSFLYRLALVVLRSKDFFTCLVSFGVAGLIFFHTVVNVGMVVGILPVVGITMPLFSYGGSSLLSFMILVGVSLGISMRRFTFMAGN